MNSQPLKRKRGRPRKVTSDLITQQKSKQNDSNNLGELSIEMTNLATNVEIEDWEQEVDDNEVNGFNRELKEIKTNIVEPNANNEPEQERSGNSFISVDKNNLFQNPTIIHIIDGEKGGCGKSFVCKTFIEYCKSIAYDMVIIDADTSNQDIAKIYPHVEVAFFSDDEKQAKEADKIFDLAFEKSVLVNLPAQAYDNVTNWVQRNDLANLGKENSIFFIKWFVCTGGVDSVNFFLKSLSDLGDDMIHVFVRNQGLCDDWSYIEAMPEFEEAIDKYSFVVMDFPKFPFWERNAIERLGINFSDAIIHPELKVVSKQRVKNFLRLAYTSLAETGLIR
ncbi:AAA family ATPase [Calothrix sp. PCC 6303]|uniref:AAA family ATPase n=1 Tax=Calothrix sp. PCC 6303 TaxID=1170562 RepID=UPI0002A034E5|nr:AAA family ATPase [Calothrix sp. PCC 6303]AFY99449.1 AT hook, DNA-binding domain-containing protein [Calothrix sp. PCC 6303]